jgi:hypothetical protein
VLGGLAHGGALHRRALLRLLLLLLHPLRKVRLDVSLRCVLTFA